MSHKNYNRIIIVPDPLYNEVPSLKIGNFPAKTALQYIKMNRFCKVMTEKIPRFFAKF